MEAPPPLPRITLFIDSCAWDELWLLCRDGVPLSDLLPPESFDLWITREQEIEIPKTDRVGKEGLGAFIRGAIESGRVKVEWLFGFDESDTPDEQRRFGGFDEGVWGPKAICDYYEAPQNKPDLTKTTNSGLFKNEGDLALAARAHVPGQFVLTAEKDSARKAKGPLQRALHDGKRVLLWADYQASALDLAEYIQREAVRLPPSERSAI